MPNNQLARRLILTLFAFTMLQGCSVIVADKPCYKPEQVAKEPALVGRWRVSGDSDIKSLRLRPNGDLFDVMFVPKDDKDSPPNLRIALFKVGDHFFLDTLGAYTTPKDNPGLPADAHQLVIVGASGSRVFVALPDNSSFEKLVGDNADQVKMQLIGKDKEALYFTDGTEENQTYVNHNLDTLFPVKLDQNWRTVFFENGNNLPIDEGDGLFSKKQRTFAYWWLISRAAHPTDLKDANADERKNYADKFVEEATALSSDGVDPEAIKAGTELVEFFKKISEGNADDKFSAVLDGNAGLSDRLAQTAKVLTKKYSLTFPPVQL